jgi:hypothetical protein
MCPAMIPCVLGSRVNTGMKKRSVFTGVGVAALLLVAAAVFMPVFDGPGSRQRAKESAAVGNLHQVTTLQTQYAAAHAAGFACRLPELKSPSLPNNNDSVDEFLVADSYAGYKFTLSECAADPDGPVRRYRVTAVPLAIRPDKSGGRAFCTDQSGQIWYDPNGSAENCLASRLPI